MNGFGAGILPKRIRNWVLGRIGLYLIVKDISQSVCRVHRDATFHIITVHKDHIKHYQGRNPPDNWLLVNEYSEQSISDLDDNLIYTSSLEVPIPPITIKSGRVIKPKQILDL